MLLLLHKAVGIYYAKRKVVECSKKGVFKKYGGKTRKRIKNEWVPMSNDYGNEWSVWTYIEMVWSYRKNE